MFDEIVYYPRRASQPISDWARFDQRFHGEVKFDF
jgi:hypothetical protein